MFPDSLRAYAPFVLAAVGLLCFWGLARVGKDEVPVRGGLAIVAGSAVLIMGALL